MFRSTLPALAAAGLLAAPASAQLSNFTQDFEGLDRTNPDALAQDGFQLFAQGINPDGSVSFGFGPFAAPNDIDNPNITVISEDALGGQGLTFFTDTNSPLNDPNSDRQDALALSLFQQQTIAAEDIGNTVSFAFTFDDAENPPSGGAIAEAFILTLDPNAGFAATNNISTDVSNATAIEMAGLLTLDLSDPALVGQILQFGFRNEAEDGEGSAVNFDNLVFTANITNPIPEPASLAILGLGGVALLTRRR